MQERSSNIHQTIKNIRRVSLQLPFMLFDGEGEEKDGPVRKCSSSSKFFPFNRDTN